jgi:hypothetical protein
MPAQKQMLNVQRSTPNVQLEDFRKKEIRRQISEIRSSRSGRESDAGLCGLRQCWRRI